MPWKNMPPDWIAAVIDALRHSEFWSGMKAFTAILVASGVGVVAKIAGEVKNGERRKFFSVQLWLDVPTLFMAAIMTVGLATYYDMPGEVSGAVGVVFGYAGPRIVDAWLAHKLRK